VDTLEKSQEHEANVLTRRMKVNGTQEDYNTDLKSKNVHTIISIITILNEATGKSELDLVAAAAKSSTTKRFIVSNWGGVIPLDE
jgi:hypothetical protein